MSAGDLLNFLKEYGPTILSAVGSILTAVFSVGLWMLQYGWKKHKRQMSLLSKSIDTLSETFSKLQDHTRVEHGAIKESLMVYRAEMHLLKQSIEPIKGGMLGLEGAINHQSQRVDRYIERMGAMEGKFDAVFRFIDAAKRATDVR